MSKKKILILILSLLFIILVGGIIISLSNTKKSYAIGTTLVDVVKAQSKGDSWSAGDSGVYYTNSHEYRYVGSNVDNYVKFNNDMYQIIGVFDSNSHGQSGKELVKLIRNRSLGGYSWGVYNKSNTSGTFYASANDWTGTTTGVKANLNVLLNEYFLNKTSTSSTYGNCGDWTYYYGGANYRTNDCTRIVGYGIDSSLRDYIETTTWYLYGGSSQSKQNWYLCERGGNSCTSAYDGTYSTDTEAKIGLMYVSDYLYASGYYSSSDTTSSNAGNFANKNWLYSESEWTINPRASSYSTDGYYVDKGTPMANYTHFSRGVRPSFYLKSSVYVTGGSGRFDDPYTIGCDDCTS